MPAIGGVFLASHDPKLLLTWFKDVFGIEMEPQGDGGMFFDQRGDGASVLAIHPATDTCPRPPPGEMIKEPYGRQPMMLNIRVDDMDEVVKRLQNRDAGVRGPVEYEGLGRFAWTRTPDGHDIEIWQP